MYSTHNISKYRPLLVTHMWLPAHFNTTSTTTATTTKPTPTPTLATTRTSTMPPTALVAPNPVPTMINEGGHEDNRPKRRVSFVQYFSVPHRIRADPLRFHSDLLRFRADPLGFQADLTSFKWQQVSTYFMFIFMFIFNLLHLNINIITNK